MTKPSRTSGQRASARVAEGSSAAATSGLAASAGVPVAAASSGRRERPTAATSHPAKQLATAAAPASQRPEWQLASEARCDGVFTAAEYPFLWACAVGNLDEVRRFLLEEQLEQQAGELKRIEREARGIRQRRGEEHEVVEETWLQQQDTLGWTAMHWASAFDRVEIMQLLYDAFLDSLPAHSSPTEDSVHLLAADSAAAFLSPVYLFLNRTSQALDTCLHVAAYNCQVGALAWLAEHGADLRARNTELDVREAEAQLGQTPLMCVVEKKRRRETRAKQAAACRWMVQHIRTVELREWSHQAEQEMTRKLPQFVPMYFAHDEAERRAHQAPQEEVLLLSSKTPSHLSPPRSLLKSEAFFATDPKQSLLGDEVTLAPLVLHHYHRELLTEVKMEDAITAATTIPAAAMKDEPLPLFNVPNKALIPNAATPCADDGVFPSCLLPLLSSLNDRRGSGATALISASFGGNLEVVHSLLQHGALVNLDLYDLRGNPVRDCALFNAISEGHLAIARLLLQWGADRFARNALDETPVLQVCSAGAPTTTTTTRGSAFARDEALRVAFLRMLFDEGVDSTSAPAVRAYYLSEPDCDGTTPFVWSARLSCVAVMRFLLDAGCDVKDVDPATDQTVLQTLCTRLQAVRALPRTSNDLRSQRKADLCAMLHLLVTHPRCAEQAREVSEDTRAYVTRAVEQRLEAALAAAGNQTPAQTQAHAADTARKRQRPHGAASATPSAEKPTPPSSSHKPLKRQRTKSDPESAAAVAAAAAAKPSASRQSARKQRPTSASKATSKPSTSAVPASTVGVRSAPPALGAPARFFKGGRQKHPDLVLAAARTAAATNEAAAQGNGEGEDLNADAEYDSEDSYSESDTDTPAHVPVPTPRIQGTIGAKLNSAHNTAAEVGAVDLTTPDAAPLMQHHDSDLNGELSHECQIDDSMMMLDHHDHDHDHHHDDHAATEDHSHQPQAGDLGDEGHGASYGMSSASHPDPFRAPDDPMSPLLGPSGLHDPLMSPSSSSSVGPIALGPFRSTDAMQQSLLASPSLMRHSTAGSLDVGSPSPLRHSTAGSLGGEPTMMRHSTAGSLGAEPESATSYSSPRSRRDTDTTMLDASPPPISSASSDATNSDAYAEVRSHLTALGLAAFIPRFIENQVEFAQWPSLADQSNEDVLKEVIPPAGPRLKFRSYIREHYCK